MFSGNFSRQHFSASSVWKLLRVQISKWFLSSIADDCANGLWVLASSREPPRSGAEYFPRGACEWDWSTCEYLLPPAYLSENKRFPERRICLRNSIVVTVAMLLSQLPITPDSTDLIERSIDQFFSILLDIIHVAVRWVSAWDGGKTNPGMDIVQGQLKK